MKVFLTNKCNLDCIYCFKDRRKKEPELSEIMRKINWARKEVIFKGGEPLTRKDIIEILKYAKSKGLDIGLETNGILLNKKILNYVNKIFFVFDTINFYDWKKITRKTKKDFEKSLKAIKLTKKLRKKVYIDSLLTKLNFNSLNETKKFCRKNKLILRIIENPIISGFEYNKSISLPIKTARFLGKRSIIYVRAKKKLLNQEKLRYYKKK